MSSASKAGYNTVPDHCIDVADNNSDSPVVLTSGSKPNNWPRCHPFIRHDIKADIPSGFHRIMKLMLFHCFYILIFLLVSFITSIIEITRPDQEVSYAVVFLFNLISMPIWIIVWGILSFSDYVLLYKAIAYNRRGCYTAFVIGTVVEILLSIFATVGFPLFTPLSIWGAFLDMRTGAMAMAFIINIAFFVCTVFLIVALVVIQVKRSKQALPLAGVPVASMVGKTQALPAEVDGREIKYINGGDSFKNARNLNTLPEDSITVIGKWKKVGSSLESEGSYLLYVENMPETIYRSSPHVDGILDNGAVNPKTQALTISRLPGGSFVFGTMDKV